MFNASMFGLTFNPNTYVVNTYNLNTFPGSSNLVDIQYVQLSNSMYGFGDDVVVIDAYLGQYVSTIPLPGNTQSIDMEYNPLNNYLYCLSKNRMWVIDPLLNSVIFGVTFSYDAYDLAINTINGDIYVSYENTNKVDIWNVSNGYQTFVTCGSSASFNMAFNSFEGDMYVTTNSNLVVRVDGATRTLQTTYGITGSSTDHTILYEPVNESIYVYGSASLWKIDNSIPSIVSTVPTQTFNQMMFNNLTGEVNISDSSANFTQLDLNTNIISQSGVSNYGYIALNQFDGDVYLSSLSLNTVIVVDAVSGAVKYTAPMSAQTTKIIYNPQRKSM
jgi:hypothetical protein